MLNISLFQTDASGQLDTPLGRAGPALGIVIPVQYGVIARAAAFPLEMNFLKSSDDTSLNAYNSSLIECLAILSAVIRWPRSFYGKTVIFITDNLSLSMNYKKGRPRGLYLCYTLRCLYNAAARLSCDLHITWQARCSSKYSVIADQLSHQNFVNVPDAITYRVIEPLPQPIRQTLVTSCDFSKHTFSQMWSRIEQYWKSNLKPL